MAGHRIFGVSFASIYPHYVTKVTKKGRSQAELDDLLGWLTGYDAAGLAATLADERTLEEFFAQAPALNPGADLVTGVICGHRVEEIEDPLMRTIRVMDKVVDELARGKALAKIQRTPA
ncbi:MAG TPA: DUF2200 domain-containing protein [Propioniciclava sp.]|jgi:hypothetical protein|uniref:DUF2200 domain-containing protein n=1 Tax=Propioniciclava sp. TaxID=2038686 RepID=UPI002B9E84CC|nr:DUF2200 domain-containing protein [Propioniciclava sp.]HRL49882.1 DUF2200 domain-containing protein [Propioniciclava sp.]HRL79632.1 DUF2200 domain-containing protein [Propioniciclava sp.]